MSALWEFFGAKMEKDKKIQLVSEHIQTRKTDIKISIFPETYFVFVRNKNMRVLRELWGYGCVYGVHTFILQTTAKVGILYCKCNVTVGSVLEYVTLCCEGV